jgi:hypothetical protein
MRRKISFFKKTGIASLLCGLALAGALLGGCDSLTGGNEKGTGEPDDDPDDPKGVYEEFYNYPTGRVDGNGGRLAITNTVASKVLLFSGSVEPGSYIGTVGSLSSVTVKLPEEKFYTIVAVEKSAYDERQAQATQFNVLTYYSNSQGYEVSVSPLSSYGAGTWIINNKTDYWVQIKKTDMTGNHAVIAPKAERVVVPVALSTAYDYFVYFSKELKYNNKVVALVETTDRSLANTAQVTDASEPYTSNITAVDVPSIDLKPAVMVKNNSNKSVRVYYAQQQKTNGGISADFVVTGGHSELISGFEINDNTSSINFAALAWNENKYVPVEIIMQAGMVYEIVIPKSENAAEITVTETDGSEYYK